MKMSKIAAACAFHPTARVVSVEDYNEQVTYAEDSAKVVELVWQWGDMMLDGPDDSDVALANGWLLQAFEKARELRREALAANPSMGSCKHLGSTPEGADSGPPTPTQSASPVGDSARRFQAGWHSAIAAVLSEIPDVESAAIVRSLRVPEWNAQVASQDGDTERLDWLAAGDRCGAFQRRPDGRWFDSDTDGSDYSPSLREAIDAARGASKPNDPLSPANIIRDSADAARAEVAAGWQAWLESFVSESHSGIRAAAALAEIERLRAAACAPVGLFKDAWEEFQGDFYKFADADERWGGSYIITAHAWDRLLRRTNAVIGAALPESKPAQSTDFVSRDVYELLLSDHAALEGAKQPMKDSHYRALLDYRMCGDGAHHSVNMDEVDALMDEEARRRGFQNWIDAYHQFEALPDPPREQNERRGL